MDKRRLGRTGHYSTIMTLGGATLCPETRNVAEAFVKSAFKRGINHVDIAPTYGSGEAETILGQWLPDYRDNVFLACKTKQRTRQAAAADLERSLQRLHTDVIDLYQLHSLDKPEELNRVLREDGALTAIREAKERGLVRYIGITSHNPDTIVRALNAFDFDTILLPVNYVLHAHPQPTNDYEPVLALAQQRDIGVIAMKAVAKGPWPSGERAYQCWYQPFDTLVEVDAAIRFALSQAVTTATSSSDMHIATMMMEATEHFTQMDAAEQARLCMTADAYTPLFPLR